MRNLKLVLFLAGVATALQSCVPLEGDRTVSCGGGHRLQVVDLDMSPDPIAEGQRINRWLVRLRADGTGECRTTIRVYERQTKDPVAQATVRQLRPGTNDIEIAPLERYQFSQEEHCYRVTADIAGTEQTVDARRQFCARRAPGPGRRWTIQRPAAD
ncbi:MAG: hypothetical protein ACREQK_17340 [Candidatus Binatia bacterium]